MLIVSYIYFYCILAQLRQIAYNLTNLPVLVALSQIGAFLLSETFLIDMVFKLYNSRKTSDSSGLPVGLKGLFDKMPAFERDKLIGEFPSKEVAFQFIERQITDQKGTHINFSAQEDEEWISVDFQTIEGQLKNLNYFLREA